MTENSNLAKDTSLENQEDQFKRVNTRQDKVQEIHTKTHHCKASKNQRQKVSLERCEKHSSSQKEEEIFRFPTRNHRGQKKVAQHFEVLKENNCQLKIPYLANTSFRNEEEMKTFSNK